MELTVIRYSSGKESTLGLLLINGIFAAYTLEDKHRDVKKMSETRISAGRYKVVLRKEGSHHDRYKVKFPEDHKGMLHIIDILGFQWILIHIGNTDDDTAGCLLVGDAVVSNINQNGRINSSTNAYKRIYPIIANTLDKGEEVWITYVDEVPTGPTHIEESYKIAVVIPDQLNLRSFPGGTKEGVLFEYTKVKVLEEQDGWNKVSLEAWVHSDYISITNY
ncbi:SH3 domain-containing protein [Labilibacter sediminis]|nr:SH3 domain-containing protein [Labilibacter sediminis]